jgi:hypothetical protein
LYPDSLLGGVLTETQDMISFDWLICKVPAIPQSDIEREAKNPIHLYHELKRFHTSSAPDIKKINYKT